MRTVKSLNGNWNYRVGYGDFKQISVPFSALPVGRSECVRAFDIDCKSEKVHLKFEGITYYAKVSLNGEFVGEMLPYSEYIFDITDKAKEKNNILSVELEDINKAYGPSDGWENFGGIIRDVSLIYTDKNYITDVFFTSRLENNYNDAVFSVKTTSKTESGSFIIRLYDGEEEVLEYNQECGQLPEKTLKNIKPWSPESPNLYRLEVALSEGDRVIDKYECNIGFREFTCDRHRFLLNGKPIFLKGVCKHEMIGDSGHCPDENEMLRDMQMIKSTGCNFVRLVHYPHNKKMLDIADRLGLMVSEEPGLWWSDTSNPEVSKGSIEVLKRTILRDRNHPSIVFWLCFNECRFTEQFLIDSAKACRQYDPTRMVSGANCMSDEDTLKYYNICGFDFYTMHPYAQTIDRSVQSAKVLHDKPLVFTEWGGHFVYDNPKLLSEFIDEMYKLYLANSDEGALAGAFFWQWSELNDFNRGRPACIDGNLYEGLVDRYRKPRLIYNAFCEAWAKTESEFFDAFWFEGENSSRNCVLLKPQNTDTFSKVLEKVSKAELAKPAMRLRRLKKGPVLEDIEGLLNTPIVILAGEDFTTECRIKTEKIALTGMVSLLGGYPLAGDYGDEVAELEITYSDGSTANEIFKNGEDVTTVFQLNGSSKINPVAKNSKRIATFGFDKNFERYVLNSREVITDKEKEIVRLKLKAKNDRYALLIYGVSFW